MLKRTSTYVAWCGRHALAIVLVHVVAVAAAVWLVAYHLPLLADFSYLLPQDAPAVRDLRELEARIAAPDLAVAVIEGDPAAARELAAALRELPGTLVERVDAGDAEQRAFLRAHRFLLVPLEDLVAARDALAKYLRDAKLHANPLYVDLDDAPAPDAKHELDELRAKRRRAEAELDRSRFVTDDGRTSRVEVRAAFRATDPERGHELVAALEAARARVVAAHPGVAIGFTGPVVFGVVEHDAIARGIAWSSAVTAVLVALVLALYFRSALVLVLLVVTIAAATAIAFGLAALTVGHLNAATAFLGAVIAGNGVNYGIMLTARFVEERRRGAGVADALAVAIDGTARATAVAALCASCAYAALAAASFKGFADFALIGGAGMLACWIVTYTLLPALISRARLRVAPREPWIGELLARALVSRVATLATFALLAAFALVIAVRYIANDPFEYDSKRLRAESAQAIEARAWLDTSDRAFGRSYTGRVFVGAHDAAQVPAIVEALRRRGDPIGAVDSILDVVPPREPERLAVLADIRRQLDAAPLDDLDPDVRAELLELRPPDELAPLATLPASVREPFTEKDGRVGLVVAVRPADHVDDWNGHDLVAFSGAVRSVARPGVAISGASVIFADVLAAIARDTPVITILAALGIAIVVVLVAGNRRRAAAVLAATAIGALLMIAACALLDIEVNFLDFIALPITLGLGVDYAINVAQRCDGASRDSVLRTAGGAVLVCSLTTMIGYASLLAVDNLAIRGFGMAALVGELTSVATALALVPALLAR